METRKNISLRVTGYDSETNNFKVLYDGREHNVRKTGRELPERLLCRITKSNDEVEITPEVEKHFHIGSIRRFTVKSDMTDSAGVYEMTDEAGFTVYLYGAEEYRFFKGKQLLCRVLSTEGSVPHVMLYDREMKNSGSAFSVSKEFLKQQIHELAETDSLAELILYDGMDGPFDVKCYEWIVSQTSLKKDNGLLESFLCSVRTCCQSLIEQGNLLSACSDDEIPVLLERLTLIIEHTGYVRSALEAISKGDEKEFVTSFLEKLNNSGYLYHPTKQFCIITYLFRIKPEIMEEMMEKMFCVIRNKNISHWKDEPFRSELIKQLETYIKSNDHKSLAQPDNTDIFYKGFQALAIQLLLSDEEEELIDVAVNRSMMCRYAAHLRFSNKKRMADMSLNSLLGLFKERLRYTLSDTGTPDKLYYHMDNWSRSQNVDRRKRAVYKSKDIVLSVEDGKISLAPDGQKDLKSALYDDIPLWKGIDVLLEKKYASPPHRSKGCDQMALNAKLWKKIEDNLFETERIIPKKEIKPRAIPEIGEWVIGYVYKQDESDKNIFHFRIDDREKGYIGEGLLKVKGEEGRPSMTTYFPDPALSNFMDEEGHPYLLEMIVADKIDDICIMDMKPIFINSLIETRPNYILDCQIGKIISDKALLAVSREGFPVFVSYQNTDGRLESGQFIRVMLKEKNWLQDCFLQAEYHSVSDIQFTLNEAFARLVYEFSSGIYEPESDGFEYEINLERSHVLELLNIIDIVASTEDDMHISYNYLGFASILSRLLGDKERMRYYKGQMDITLMLHKFATTNDVDIVKLQELHTINSDLLRSNYYLRHQYYRLYAVSLMGHENNEWLERMTKDESDENLRELASLVYSYNVLARTGIDTTDVKKAIMELLKLKGRDAYFKVYTASENFDVEFKTSIVYPPNTMKPDIEKQTFNIMKEICAFLNHKGGRLYLGVNNEGGGEGLEEDMKHELFRDSRDRYDNYVRNQIVLQMGQEASHCIEAHFDDDARGRDVYILDIQPCEHPVKLDGNYYQRHGSSCRKVDKDYVKTFLKNRSAEYAVLMKERGVTVPDAVPEISADPIPAKTETTVRPAGVIRNIPTSVLRNNILHDYEDGYEYTDCYIHLDQGHKYIIERQDSYEEFRHMLTLAIHENELDGYLLLAYEDATFAKIPMAKILDKDPGKEYSRYSGKKVIFACPVCDDDMLYQCYEYRGETFHRLQDISSLEECNMGDMGDLLFDVSFDKIINTDIVPHNMKDKAPKSITDRRRLGYTMAKNDGRKSYAFLKQIGLIK